jgi:putative ABC transport system permease protein
MEMLELKDITKEYKTANEKVKALKGISLKFRESEFVSILGQSGCGKTTLLNIVGGLDRYTTGDLIIDGKSTKKFKDRDWDAYRNHKVGFVFQSYNLISHQTVLSNVELALTIGGMSKKDRKKKAIKALEQVGLKEHINKKPNQLSGGQMQRVAIARALVNDPDIILADEPTGALDTKTSVQIMDILKKISENRLIVMVTHNPELAEKYSSRIIKILDGKITEDSNPVKKEELKEEKEEVKKKKKNSKAKIGRASMSFLTALKLSLNNLLTKKGRTILVSLAGSIGIIGIALVQAVSNGFQGYVDHIQEDTLTSYPLTIMEESSDMTSMLLSMTGAADEGEKEELGENEVREEQYISKMLDSLTTNDLRSFKKHLEENDDKLKKDVSSIRYAYENVSNSCKEWYKNSDIKNDMNILTKRINSIKES